MQFRPLLPRRASPVRSTAAISYAAAALFLTPVPSAAQGTPEILVSRRDSAGIQIIESRPAAVGTTPRAPLAVDTTPMLLLPSGNAPELLRLGGARVLRNGTVVVGDDGRNAIHYFSRYGAFLRSAGNTGAENARLSAVRTLDVRGDSVIVCCGTGVLAFGPNGNFLSSTPAFRGEYLGTLRNGRHLVRRTTSETAAYQGVRGVVKSLLMDTLFTVDSRGSFSAAVAVLPSRVHTSVFNPDPNPLGLSITYMESPFEAESRYATYGDGFLFADGQRLEVRQYSSAGRLTRIIRLAVDAPPVTAEMADRFRSAVLSKYSVAETRSYIQWVLGEYRPPLRIAHLAEVRAATDGSVWVQERSFPEGALSRWHIFASTGAYQGSLTLPSSWRVLQVGGEFVLASVPGSGGAEGVGLYRVERM